MLCTAFCILSILALHHSFRSQKHGRELRALALLAFLPAILSKEMAISLVLILPLQALLFDRAPGARLRAMALFVSLALISAAYFGVRLAVLGSGLGGNTFEFVGLKFLLAPYVFMKYLGLLFAILPVDPHHMVRMPPEGWARAVPLVSGIGVTAAYLAAWGWVARGGRHPVLTFCLAWLPLSLAPVFNFGTFGDILLADRFLYLPGVGFAIGILAVATHPDATPHPQAKVLLRTGYALYLLGALSLGYLARENSRYWESDFTLFEYAASTSPDSSYIQFNVANGRAAQGDTDGAIQAFARTVQLDPYAIDAFINLASVLNKTGLYPEAIQALHRALALTPDNYYIAYNMGAAHRGMGNHEEAVRCFKRSLAFQPTDVAHSDLGESLLQLGRTDEAASHFLAALQLKPSFYAFNNLGIAQLEMGEPGKAVQSFRQALMQEGASQKPAQRILLRYNLARALHRTASPSAAVYAREVIRLIHAIPAPSPVEQEIRAEMEPLVQPAHPN
jgi:tetratricopeptide (TPR) repeat protein